MTAYLFLILLFTTAFSITIIYGIKYRSLAVLFLLSLVFRIGLLFLDYSGAFSLPGGGNDAQTFVDKAQSWSELNWSSIFQTFGMSHSYNYSVIGALVFKIFGYHDLILPALNLVAGTIIVVLTGAITYRMWGERAAQVAVLIMAVYPYSAFNSAIALREEISILAFVTGLYFLVKWLREESIVGIYICLLFFALATMIHPGWVAAILGVGAYTFFLLLKAVPQIARGSQVTRRYLGKLILSTSILVLTIGLVSAGGVTLGKGISIGTDKASITQQIESEFVGEPVGGSSYPVAIATGNPITQPWLIPARIVYFLFSPFPWDIKSPVHLFGFISSGLYVFLVWRIFKSWKKIKHKQECLALLIMLAVLIFVFAIGVTNIGTAIRHKTKFLVLFVVLAAASFDTMKIKFGRRL
ncbi:MAG: hypothetical protein U9Q35_05385 [Pseudomonadota bacterium]|nr:hypothetical protein [Pseudomonadota bacterium]